MERYDTRIADDVLYLETPDGEIEVGSMTAVCELLGGETYTVEYDPEAAAMAWLDVDEDDELTFDVRETIADLDFDERFVRKVAGEPLDRETPEGHPRRTDRFAELMRTIWDSRGSVDPSEL